MRKEQQDLRRPCFLRVPECPKPGAGLMAQSSRKMSAGICCWEKGSCCTCSASDVNLSFSFNFNSECCQAHSMQRPALCPACPHGHIWMHRVITGSLSHRVGHFTLSRKIKLLMEKVSCQSSVMWKTLIL